MFCNVIADESRPERRANYLCEKHLRYVFSQWCFLKRFCYEYQNASF